ncbi:MAG: hypothetical protein JW991_02105 [Candidatus Pacebacteria bacterium]|nr:hypothetical protein [Candidatus Paceibacterota bacterium]
MSESQESFDPQEMRIHYRDHIFHFPGAWSQQYAEDVGRFIHSHPDHTFPRHTEPLARLAAEGADFTTGKAPLPILDRLHLTEAELRGITPGVFQRVIFMQDQLYNSGYRPDSWVSQRTEIVDFLGLSEAEAEDLTASGVKAAGLELSVRHVWDIKEVNPEAAKRLMQEVTDLSGRDYYQSQLDWARANTGQSLEEQTAASERMSEAAGKAFAHCADFYRQLSPRENRRIAFNQAKRLTKIAQEGIVRLAERVSQPFKRSERVKKEP